jgi:methionine synthase I (cobalamin-dependent)
MQNRFLKLLAERSWLLADGATGTTLFAMGLQSGDSPELWNVDHPDRIAALHRGFIDAGSDIVLTNSFGGTRFRLALHGAEGRVDELNEAAARIARAEADAAGRTVVVAGSIGPTGELFEPLGTLTRKDAVDAFARQAQALVRGGADVLWIETMSAREEVEAAVEGAGTTGLPIVFTVSFDTNGRTMMGLGPAELVSLQAQIAPHPAACGTNCGIGAAEVVACLLQVGEAAGPDLVVVAKANCGIPEWVDGAIRYNGTPELMARYACMVRDAGARIIGGCCGTTAEHVRAMREALDRVPPGARPTLEQIQAVLGPVSAGARGEASGGGGRRRARGGSSADGGASSTG